MIWSIFRYVRRATAALATTLVILSVATETLASAFVAPEIDRLLNTQAAATPFPGFQETPQRFAAFSAVKAAMGINKPSITALDITNGSIVAAEKALRANGALDTDGQAVIDELHRWLFMKQQVINYFSEIDRLFNTLEIDQVSTIDTIYDSLTLEYPPSFNASEELGQIYVNMLLGGLGTSGSFLGGSNVDSVAFAGGAIGGAVGIVNMAITAANDIERLQAEEKFALETKDKIPLQLHKVRLVNQVRGRFDDMRNRSQEIKDRVLGDYALLQVFSREKLLTGGDLKHIKTEYSRAFAKQMWLFFLGEKSTFQTILLEPTELDQCAGGLSRCADRDGKRASAHDLAQDIGLLAIGYIARERERKCRSGGSTTFRYAFKLGRQKHTASGDAQIDAIDPLTLREIYKSGVTRGELVNLVGKSTIEDKMETLAISSCSKNKQRYADRLLGSVLVIDELHSAFLGYADIREINFKNSSEFPPALEVFTPVGKSKPELFLAFHGPASRVGRDRDGVNLWKDTIYLTHSADGENWTKPVSGYDFYRPGPRHTPRTGPALLALDKRLLVSYGSAASDKVYGYFIDGSTYQKMRETFGAQFCKLTVVPKSEPGAVKDLDGKFKKYICDERKIEQIQKSYNFDAPFTYEMDPGIKQRVIIRSQNGDETRDDGAAKGVELLDVPFNKFLSPDTRATTKQAPALTRTLLADLGPTRTNNAAILLFTDPENGLQMSTGDFTRFPCWRCTTGQDNRWIYDDLLPILAPIEAKVAKMDISKASQRNEVRALAMPKIRERIKQSVMKSDSRDSENETAAQKAAWEKAAENEADRLAPLHFATYERIRSILARPEPLAETSATAGIAPHPDWLAIAYLSEPKGKQATLEFFTYRGAPPEKVETIPLPNDAVPASGPSLVYDLERGILFLAVADTDGALHLLKRQPGEDSWTSLRVVKNETKERPALAIFQDRIYVALRRQSGQIVAAPIYDLLEPRTPFMLPDDPRFASENARLVDTDTGLWEAPQERRNRVGLGGWRFGTPTIGPKAPRDYSGAWFTAPSNDYPVVNSANTVLITPPIKIAANGKVAPAILSFEHWIRSSPNLDSAGGRVSHAIEFDSGRGDFKPLQLNIGGTTTNRVTDTNGAWQKVAAELPVELLDKTFVLKFEFNDPGDGISQNGWVIDNVEIAAP